MKHTEVVDWRVWKAAVVQANAGLAQAGDHVYVCTKLEDSVLGPFSFVTPSPIALALEIAARAARKATAMRMTLVSVPKGGGQAWLEVPRLKDLYSFFQQGMIAATFSYQCLESFANHLISNANATTIDVERKGQIEKWTPEDVERRCSTEEKLGTIVPALSKATTIKGTQLWERLNSLKDLRDSTVHLKSIDQYVRGAPDNQTLYYRFLSADLLDGPRTAVSIIRQYSHPASLAWLAVPNELLA